MASEPARVIHYTRFHSTERWGGREQVVDQYCRGLRDHGFESTIFATSAFSKPGEDLVLGVPVQRFPYSYPFIPLSAERRARMDRKGGNPLSSRLLAALRASPPDLVHLHTGARLGALIRRFCEKAGIPVVYSLHGGQFVVPEAEAADIASGNRGLLDWGKVVGWWSGVRRLAEDVDRLLCVGMNEYHAAQERGLTNVAYLPNGVDEEHFGSGDGARFRAAHGLESNEIILCCGRIDTQKNQTGLVDDLAPLLRERPAARLVLVGSTTNESFLERVRGKARDGGVEEQVVFTGNLPPDGSALPDAYAACDAFILPSVAEPFGIVILEAWAARRPVTASRVDGIPFFVEDEKNGLLFDPHEPGAMRRAVARVLDDSDLAGRLAKAGRNSVEQEFTWKAITGRLAEMYRELLT